VPSQEWTARCADVSHVEFVDHNGEPQVDGQQGRVLITDLENYAFPLIRYENGDGPVNGRRNKCRCGLPFPLIAAIQGRSGGSDSFGGRSGCQRVYANLQRLS